MPLVVAVIGVQAAATNPDPPKATTLVGAAIVLGVVAPPEPEEPPEPGGEVRFPAGLLIHAVTGVPFQLRLRALFAPPVSPWGICVLADMTQPH